MKDIHILLVDDEVAIVQVVEMILKKEGFQHIYKAHTGKDAIHILQKETIDFIVLDVMLPDANGFALCQEIRTISQAYILFLTAKVSDFDILTGLSGAKIRCTPN